MQQQPRRPPASSTRLLAPYPPEPISRRHTATDADESERLDLDASATDEADERLARTPDLDAPATDESLALEASEAERADWTDALCRRQYIIHIRIASEVPGGYNGATGARP